MGNQTNAENWAAQERLRFIERAAWWRGFVRRQDLASAFGLSQAQASSDLQKYQELNPGALLYNLRLKRYEGAPAMVTRLHAPDFSEAIALFLPGGGAVPAAPRPTLRRADEATIAANGDARVDMVVLPPREGEPEALRRVFQAVLNNRRLRVRYASLSGRGASWRWIAPHAFGHDGYRWHARVWAIEDRGHRDYVLSRIAEAEWPVELEEQLPPDEEWESWETLRVQPNRELRPEQREAIARDYGMRRGVLTLRVRRAMREYLLAHLRIPPTDGRTELPAHLERAE